MLCSHDLCCTNLALDLVETAHCIDMLAKVGSLYRLKEQITQQVMELASETTLMLLILLMPM